jgi:tRNA dimethylallyltransferase
MPAAPAHDRPIVILGPTAGGKSELAVVLAERLGGEIISADSMQIYRRMDAGTAKPSPALRARVPHHLIDCVEPTDRFTVADWLQQADALITAMQARACVPIVVGGTNLYIQALLEGLFEGPAHDAELRDQLSQIDSTALHARLAAVDPAAADRIHPNDRKKLIRAIEVFEQTGQPISRQQRQWGDARCGPYRRDARLVGLVWPPAEVNRRINLRVKAMFDPAKAAEQLEQDGLDPAEVWWTRGLVEETADLHARGQLGPQAREALGYKQVLAHLAGRWTRDEAFEQTKIQTRRFAKRQRTWLKRFTAVAWIEAPEKTAEALADVACAATIV